MCKVETLSIPAAHSRFMSNGVFPLTLCWTSTIPFAFCLNHINAAVSPNYLRYYTLWTLRNQWQLPECQICFVFPLQTGPLNVGWVVHSWLQDNCFHISNSWKSPGEAGLKFLRCCCYYQLTHCDLCCTLLLDWQQTLTDDPFSSALLAFIIWFLPLALSCLTTQSLHRAYTCCCLLQGTLALPERRLLKNSSLWNPTSERRRQDDWLFRMTSELSAVF